MSRSVWARAGVTLLLLALTPGSAIAAGHKRPADHATRATHRSMQGPAAVRVGLKARRAGLSTRRILSPGTGYASSSGSRPVRTLQRRLHRLGFASGPIDGRYGPLTTQAVERFQGSHGLAMDGIAGPRTLTALRAHGPVVLSPGAGYAGSSGSRAVRRLQRRLDRLGFASGPIDGRYGPLTTQAVERFQGSHGLAVDGIAGPRTLTALMPHRTSRSRRRATRPAAARPHRVIRPHRLAPKPPWMPSATHPRPLPELPVTAVLLVLAGAGLLTGERAYLKTRARTRPGPVRRQTLWRTGAGRGLQRSDRGDKAR